MSREMKDSGIDYINEIPKDWKVIKNKYLFIEEKSIVGFKFFDYQLLSLTTRGVKTKNIDNPNGKLPESFSTYQEVRKDNLILCLFDLDVSAVFSGVSNYDGMISPAYKVINYKREFDKDFIDFWFKNIGFDRSYMLHSKSLRHTINSDNFKEILSVYPSIVEQKKIGSFLRNEVRIIEDIIEQTKATIEDYKLLKQSIISETVTKGFTKNVEMKDSGVEWIGAIPSEWQIIKLKYLLKEKKETSLNGKEEPLSMSQVYGVIPSKHLNSIPNPKSSYVGNRIVKSGDLVFNKLKAHLGVFSVSNYEGIVSPDYAVYTSKSIGKVQLKYLEFLFKTTIYINEFKKRSTGVGLGLTRLYTDELFSMKCQLPPIEEQAKIIGHIETLHRIYDNLIQKKQDLLMELELYKKSLIYEYVTGKKEVK